MTTGIIYRIIDNTNNNIYYGSTTRTIGERKAEHKYQYKQFCQNKRSFTTVYDILKNNNWTIEIVENCLENLKEREGWYIENNNCVNKRIESRTLNKYYNDILKPYRQNISYYCKVCNCDVKVGEVKRHEKTKKHLGLERKKRQRTVDPNEKILCECGVYYTRQHKSRHMKTIKHNSIIGK